MTRDDEIERGIRKELVDDAPAPDEWGYRSLEDVDPEVLWKQARGREKKAACESRIKSGTARKFELRRQLARIEEGMSLQCDPEDGALAAILCPKCQRRIIPQFTYTGRKYALFIEHFGLEKHGTARFCPLCGVDFDWYIEELLSELRGLERTSSGDWRFWFLMFLVVMILTVFVITYAQSRLEG